MNSPIRVFLVDDNPRFLEAAQDYLRMFTFFEIAGAVREAQSAIEQALQARPDVILLDLNLGAHSGVDLIPSFKQSLPEARIVVLTSLGEDGYQVPVLRVGADAFIHKSRLTEKLTSTIFRLAGWTEGMQFSQPSAASLTEAELRALFAAMQDVVITLDRDGIYRKIAPTNPGLLVLPPQELLGKAVHEIFPAAQADLILEAIRRALETKQVQTIEYPLQIADSYLWFSASITSMDDDHVVLVARDVTERKQAEQAFQRQHDLYTLLANHSTDGITLVGPDNTIEYMSPSHLRMLGYTENEVLGMGIAEILAQIHPEDRERVAAQSQADRAKWRETSLFEYRIRRKDGDYLWVEDLVRRTFDDQGVFVSAIVNSRDINQRKLAEQALKAAEERYRDVFENAVEGIFQSTPQGTYLEVNRAMARIYGYESPQEMLALVRDIPRQIYVLREDREEFARLLAENGRVEHFEAPNYRKDSSIIWVNTNARIYQRDDGTVVYEGFLTDVTEQRRAQEALRESEQRFRALIRDLNVGVILQGPQAEIFLNNQAALDLLGLTEDRLLGKTSFDPDWNVIHEDGSPFPGAEHPVPRAIATRQPVRDVVMGVYRPALEDRVWLLVNAEPQFNADGELRHVICTFSDITARKRMEASLAESEQRYRTLYETIPSMNFTLDENGVVLTVNRFGLDQLGYDEAELVGQSVLKVFFEEDRAGVLAGLKSCLENPDQIQQWEKRKVKKDGTQIWVSETVRTMQDEKGAGKLLVACYDVTERKRAEDKISRQVEFLTALKDIDRVILSSFELRLSLGSLVSKAVTLLDADAADILITNPILQLLEFGAGTGFKTTAIQTSTVKIGESYAGRAALERRVVHVADLSRDVSNLFVNSILKDEKFVDYFGMPLIVKGEVVGVLEVFSRRRVDRGPEWCEFLEALAGQAAIAIDNARLFNNLKRSNFELTLAYDATIEGWSRALDLRDKETEGHTRRVTEQTLELARLLKLPEKELIQVRYGALLHDIGKMGVPDNILLKPGSLTAEEWDVMRLHPVFAHDLLVPIRHLKEAALDIPYCHHERWDGTGYPRGLKGDEIPFSARMFAVVDVWDALTSDRPYRKAWGKKQAWQYIREQAGLQFDPQMVDAFQHVIAGV